MRGVSVCVRVCVCECVLVCVLACACLYLAGQVAPAGLLLQPAAIEPRP